MKILQIANGYFGNKLYRNLFAALRALNVTNKVFVPINRKASIPKDMADDPELVVSKCFSDFDRLLFYSKQRKLLGAIKNHAGLEDVDAVHAHTLFSGGFSAYQLRRQRGLPYIVAVRNTDVNVFFRWMIHLRGIGVEIMRNAEKVIFLSPAYQKTVLQTYVPAQYRDEILQKSVVIPNGISDLFLETRPAPKVLQKNDALRLIYVGEINANKNLEETIQASELLRQKGRTISLTVVGAVSDEKYRAILENTGFVEYYDRCLQEEVLKHLAGADIFVMPSHTETFGLVYAEAMSQGLPVLYTRGQGFDGHFPDGTVGYAVSDRDPAELAEKIEQVVSRYAQISGNCVQLADKFNWETIAEQYKKIYLQMISERN